MARFSTRDLLDAPVSKVAGNVQPEGDVPAATGLSRDGACAAYFRQLRELLGSHDADARPGRSGAKGSGPPGALVHRTPPGRPARAPVEMRVLGEAGERVEAAARAESLVPKTTTDDSVSRNTAPTETVYLRAWRHLAVDREASL